MMGYFRYLLCWISGGVQKNSGLWGVLPRVFKFGMGSCPNMAKNFHFEGKGWWKQIQIHQRKILGLIVFGQSTVDDSIRL